LKALAPIILFAYNRPRHTEQALEALAENAESAHSILYIFADGPKENASVNDLQKIQDTRTILLKKKWCREVKIMASEINIGLANSIIN